MARTARPSPGYGSPLSGGFGDTWHRDSLQKRLMPSTSRPKDVVRSLLICVCVGFAPCTNKASLRAGAQNRNPLHTPSPTHDIAVSHGQKRSEAKEGGEGQVPNEKSKLSEIADFLFWSILTDQVPWVPDMRTLYFV